MQQKKANCLSDCISESTASKKREKILPFYLALVRLYLEYCAERRDPLYKKDINKLKQVQPRLTKMTKGLERRG